MDSLDTTTLTPYDKEILDSSLTLFHNAPDDTSKIRILEDFIEACNNLKLWSKYNAWLFEFIENKLNTKTFLSEEIEAGTTYWKLLNSKAHTLEGIAYLLLENGNISDALKTHQKSYQIQEAIGDKMGMANSLTNIGYAYMQLGNISSALDFYYRALDMHEAIGNKQNAAITITNIGFVFDNQGDIVNALECYHKALKIQEAIDDKFGMAAALNNIGSIYLNQRDFDKAREYCENALHLQEEVKDKNGIATSLNNLGGIFRLTGELSKALEYNIKALKVREEIGDALGISNSLNNIGAFYKLQGDHTNALTYLFRALQIQESSSNKSGMVSSLNNIADIELGKGNYKAAEEIAKRSLRLGEEVRLASGIMDAAFVLHHVNKSLEKFENALSFYELHIKMRDSILNEKTQKASIRQQTKYEFEKARLIKDQAIKEQKRISDEAISRRDNLQYSIILVGILAVFGLIFSFGFVNVSSRMAEGLIFFAFLILFEFLLVFTEPYLDSITGGAPIYKLLVNAVLAGLIFPLHSFFEKLLKQRIVEDKRKVHLRYKI